MKTRRSPIPLRLGLLSALLLQCVLLTGCTTALWDKNTFADYHRPADPANLRLFYSNDRKDFLVKYDERSDKDGSIHARCYWLEENAIQINRGSKPHFSSLSTSAGLTAIPVSETAPVARPSGGNGISAVARPDNNGFTFYEGVERLDPYTLPIYVGPSRRVKQVLLTPFAVTVDATIIGAVIGYYSAPGIFSNLNR